MKSKTLDLRTKLRNFFYRAVWAGAISNFPLPDFWIERKNIPLNEEKRIRSFETGPICMLMTHLCSSYGVVFCLKQLDYDSLAPLGSVIMSAGQHLAHFEKLYFFRCG